MKLKDFFINGATGFAMFAEAGFAGCGMINLLKDIPLIGPPATAIALIAAVFAAAIEGEVFRQNIRQAVRYIQNRDGLQHRIIQDIIIDLHNKNLKTQYANSHFLVTYRTAFNALKKAEEDHHHNIPIDKNEIKAHKKNLSELEQQILLYMQKPKAACSDEIVFLFQDQIPIFNTIYQRKRGLIYAAHFFNVLSTIGCFYSSLFVSQQLLLFFGVSGSIAMGGVIAIAALAACAYALMIYRTLLQIIYTDFVVRYWEKLKNAFINGNRVQKASIILGMVILVALIVGLTLATAGTWWKTGLAGQMLLFNLSGMLAKATTIIFIACYTAASIIFNSKNIIESLDEVTDLTLTDVKKLFFGTLENNFITPFNELILSEESWFESTTGPQKIGVGLVSIFAFALHAFINASFILWHIFSFIGHCISEGVKTDSAFFLPDVAATVVAGSSEALVDTHCVFAFPHKQTKAATDQIQPLVRSTDDGHHHSNIPGKFFYLILGLPLILDAWLYSLCTGLDAKKIFWRHWDLEHADIDSAPSGEPETQPLLPKPEESKIEVKLPKNGFHPKRQNKNEVINPAQIPNTTFHQKRQGSEIYPSQELCASPT